MEKKVGGMRFKSVTFCFLRNDKSTFEERQKRMERYGGLLNADDDSGLDQRCRDGNPGDSFDEFAPGGAAPAKRKKRRPAAVEEAKPVAQATAARAEGVSPRARATAISGR
jgi:hypothetical protein